MRDLNMMKRWKTKRRIKKLEKRLDAPIKVSVDFSSWDFKGFEEALEVMAKEIANQIDTWQRNIKDELESLKQSIHR